jgi:hypothetical protein
MKIPESIIEKYQLTPSGEQTGQSFIQNQLLYKSGLPAFENIVFMECDFTGKPNDFINFYNKTTKRDGAITPEFMEDVPIEVILKAVS